MKHCLENKQKPANKSPVRGDREARRIKGGMGEEEKRKQILCHRGEGSLPFLHRIPFVSPLGDSHGKSSFIQSPALLLNFISEWMGLLNKRLSNGHLLALSTEVMDCNFLKEIDEKRHPNLSPEKDESQARGLPSNTAFPCQKLSLQPIILPQHQGLPSSLLQSSNLNFGQPVIPPRPAPACLSPHQ